MRPQAAQVESTHSPGPVSKRDEDRMIDTESAMRRALELAALGPVTGGNPQVGCVVLDPSGHILAEGWHAGAGTEHAEVVALSKVPDARGSTVVVTLEPCNHTGRTGPCTQALLAAGVERVVYAVADPGELSRGGGEALARAGVSVTGGVLETEVSEFMHPWLTALHLRRPFTTLKWAATLDGRVAAADGSSRWITGEAARTHAHAQRARADAILVGTGTVFADDPALTARDPEGRLLEHQPVPVVVGERSVPADARLRRHPAGLIETGSRRIDAILDDLFDRGMRRVLVEGGPTLATAFVAAGLVDEYLAYLAPVLLGGDRLVLGDIGIRSIDGALRLATVSVERLGDDLLATLRPGNSNSPEGS